MRHSLGECAQASCVFIPAATHALIGQIDQRHQPACAELLRNVRPELRCGIHTGGIVAAAVQQYRVARPGIAQRIQHTVKVIIERHDLQPRGGEYRCVIRPRR